MSTFSLHINKDDGLDNWVIEINLHNYWPQCHIITFVAYTVYILKTSSDTLYIGQTNNLSKRIKEHQSKSTRSAKYMKYFSSFELVYKEECRTRSEDLKREWQLK